MEILTDPQAFRAACDQARGRGQRVGLVPTMGALHDGHIRLVEIARQHADHVVLSVFVNPTQFGPNEDFARYPRTLDADAERCARAGVAVLFTPPADAMYPRGEETRVRVGATAEPFCGVFRPGHFEGVCTVVAKLFALTGPSVAVFGKKDYQQLRVIERMARDLFFPIEIVGAPTHREADGLAMSSRNRYLSPEDRARVVAIPRGLSAAHAAFAAGERRAGALTDLVRSHVAPIATSIDYVDVADAESLRVHGADDAVGDRAVLALALRVAGARLIDNVVLGVDPAPC